MITQFNRKRKCMKFVAVLSIVLAMSLTAAFALNNKNEVHPDQIIVDDIDLPFVEDSAVLGEWHSVDFVHTMDSFDPENKCFSGELYMTQLVFLENGELKFNDDQDRPWFKWTKGVVTHSGDNTASKYVIQEIDGSSYMFCELKNGDYIFRGTDPSYYVLKKVE